MEKKSQTRIKKITRTRKKLGKSRPRLTVFRSNLHIYAQIIDDQKAITLVGISDLELKDNSDKISKSEKAFTLGKLLAEKAKSKKITEITFDRGPYSYHGHVKSLAEGARSGGLKF